jgi:peptide/nickel transport system permease protein
MKVSAATESAAQVTESQCSISWFGQLGTALLGLFSRRPDALTGGAQQRPRSAAGYVSRANPQVLLGVGLLLSIAVLALSAGLLYPGDPLDTVAAPMIEPLTDVHYWLGTDSLGRDVAAGIVHGSRASLLIGATAALLGVVIGTVIGALAGFFGGWVDGFLVRVTEIVQTTPAFLLVIVIVTIGQPSMPVISVAIAIASWPMVARLVRAEFRSLVNSEFVTAARSLGYGPVRIIFHEVLPNALPPIIVTASVMVASAILMESALAFLGQGDPNRISWGSMIGSGREMLRTAPSLTILPGAALVVTILSLNLLGDGLNKTFNPRLRERR